jgi:hypothetical protein
MHIVLSELVNGTRRYHGLLDTVEVTSAKVPRRSLDGDRQQLPQGTQPLGAYLVPRPADTRDVSGQQPLEAGDVTPAQRLTGTIRWRAHDPILRDPRPPAHPTRPAVAQVLTAP